MLLCSLASAVFIINVLRCSFLIWFINYAYYFEMLKKIYIYIFSILWGAFAAFLSGPSGCVSSELLLLEILVPFPPRGFLLWVLYWHSLPPSHTAAWLSFKIRYSHFPFSFLHLFLQSSLPPASTGRPGIPAKASALCPAAWLPEAW